MQGKFLEELDFADTVQEYTSGKTYSITQECVP